MHRRRISLVIAIALLLGAATLAGSFTGGGKKKIFHSFGDPYPRIVHQVFYYVQKRYVEPDRVSPRDLLEGALEALEDRYPEVLTDLSPDGKAVTVRVDEAAKTFDLGAVSGFSRAADLLNTVLRFVETRLGDEVEKKDLYYVALNGALEKLDPHSNVFSPKHFKEFMIGTRGTFGGIGFVFGIRDGEMTIITPIEGTPADRAGLRSGDKILYIDGEPTINMPVDVAANKMRGEPGTQVTLTIQREGWSEPRAITFTREIIHVDSVESYVLSGDGQAPVLYAKVKNFQKNTTKELRRAVAEARKAHPDLVGIVLDLRNNPGGLLDQAIALSDGFLDEGTIVSTRGPEKDANSRSVAKKDPPISTRPLVILVNQGSASASEIVSGALKASRALLIGQKTFGKGSVQKLYPLTDGGALKLTVAQYLTPGDVSIQSIGIQPDIAVYPARISKGKLRLGPPPSHVAEADLENAFKEWGNASEKPWVELQYLEPERGEDDDERTFAELSREEKVRRLAEDFEIRLARRVLERAPGPSRADVMKAAEQVVPEVQAEEDGKIQEALKALGVDWGPGQAAAAVDLRVPPAEELVLVPGEKAEIRFTVENRGKTPVYRVWGRTESDNPLLRNLDFAFGRLDPGEKRSWSAEVEVPKSAPERWDTVTLNLRCEGVEDAGSGALAARVEGTPRPMFAYAYRLSDENPADPALSGDGRLQEGERARLVLDVANRGDAESGKVEVNIRGEEKEQLYLEKARYRFEAVDPGQTVKAPMAFRVVKAEEDGRIRVGVSVTDRDYGVFFSDNLTFHTDEPYPAAQRREPPRFELKPPPLHTDAGRIVIEVTAVDDEAVKDVYAYRGRDKIRYVRNRSGGARLPVRLEVDLEEGSNRIVVVARDDKEIVASRAFFVYRTRPGDPGTELTMK